MRIKPSKKLANGLGIAGGLLIVIAVTVFFVALISSFRAIDANYAHCFHHARGCALGSIHKQVMIENIARGVFLLGVLVASLGVGVFISLDATFTSNVTAGKVGKQVTKSKKPHVKKK